MNNKIIFGIILLSVGIFMAIGAYSMLPDAKPIVTSILIAAVGVGILASGLRSKENPPDPFNILSLLTILGLFAISALLLPTIEWQHPKDPAGVMILTFLTALTIIYASRKDSEVRKLATYSGLIAILNFSLIRVYESGALDFIGKFYRVFIPLYENFDSAANGVEYSLIALTVILTAIFAYKKIRVADFGKLTLTYFIVQPLLAIFLFEMLGLPAGFLAGTTTRSDLLVTDTNALMSTIGIIFIGALAHNLFLLFPVWVAPVFAGFWWVFWKPWLLHHPDPAVFTSFQAFWPAALFLFFTGFKRVALPMYIVTGLPKLLKRK